MCLVTTGALDTEFFDVSVWLIEMSLKHLESIICLDSDVIRDSSFQTSWLQEGASGDWAIFLIIVIEERSNDIFNDIRVLFWS